MHETQFPKGPTPLSLEVERGVAVLTLNRPDVYNALNVELREEIAKALDRISRNDEIRALVLTGAGKGFCAGADVTEMPERLSRPAGKIAMEGWLRQRRNQRLVLALHQLEKPTIAAVNGVAAGLGADLALACDFILVSSSASFRMSYIARGLVPDGGGLYFLPRRVGLALAKELIFTGRPVEAHEALSIGLADRISEQAELVANARAWAEELCAGSAAAIGLSKSILDRSLHLDIEETFVHSAQAQAVCYTTDEHKNKVAEFLKKKK